MQVAGGRTPPTQKLLYYHPTIPMLACNKSYYTFFWPMLPLLYPSSTPSLILFLSLNIYFLRLYIIPVNTSL
jgi:hypothetical protein